MRPSRPRDRDARTGTTGREAATRMFDELGTKLDGALKKLRQRGVLTEPMIKEGLREVRRVLLEADVNFKVTRDFLGRVQERALGEQVLKAVSPGQQIVKIVHDELANLFGEGRPTLEKGPSSPRGRRPRSCARRRRCPAVAFPSASPRRDSPCTCPRGVRRPAPRSFRGQS